MQPHKNHSSPPCSMETHVRKPSSGDTVAAFSFPSMPAHDSPSPSSSSDDFEFGCLTPDSPSGDPNKNSPADHLFFNGRLLPHAFPFRSPAAANLPSLDLSRGTSRTSSISSKDYSLVSSRSNSTNSSCSSNARTSFSDNLERRSLSYSRQSSKTTLNGSGSSKVVSAHVYGSSQRWQFMAPVPALSREGSRRKKVMLERNDQKDQEKKAATKRRIQRRLGRRLLRWLVTACKECHAIEPSRKDEVLKGNVNLR